MNFGTFSYAATVVIFTGLAMLLYLSRRFYFSSGNAKLFKSDWKVIALVILITTVATSPGEWVALAWRIWTYNPERTFSTTFLGAEAETYLFAILVSLVVSIATLLYARREDCHRKTVATGKFILSSAHNTSVGSKNIKPREGLPAHARLVFKGVIFEVWQWEQEMFDGTTEIFEKVWRPATVEIIATVGDKILMEKQDQPNRKNNINVPSGRVDEGEDVLEAAKRELLEETGYRSDKWDLFLKHVADGKVLHEVYYFIARDCAKTREPSLDAGEKIETKLVGFDDFIRLTEEPRFWMSPEFINYLLRVQADQAKKEAFWKLLFPQQ